MKIKNLLPIGSVVMLKESNKRLMIYGIMQRESPLDEVYDYIGVPYPEGFLDIKRCYLFNEDAIDEVFFLGYIDSEFQLFKGKLIELLDK